MLQPMEMEKNYQKAAAFIKDAASQGAELALLPEYFLTSWVPANPGFAELCSHWETYLKKFQALAKEHKICIVPGTIVEKHGEEKSEEYDLLNVAYFIDDKGEILGKYIKKNLWHPERAHLTSSTHDPHITINTPLGKIGMLICWDLAFPEAFRALITSGARLILIPCFWTLNDCSPFGLGLNPRSEALFLDSTLTARTFENTCGILFANAGGPKEEGYAGLSQVVMPFTGPIMKMEGPEEGMRVCEIDMGWLDEAEKNYKVREDLAKEDWHYPWQ
ncbi:hypothetical protein EG328_007266 [Venturia inaequalis]|uniref:CN hydrolase domain-containing protein n=2 Tax=Venturia inaequalis TaxID=5025 RepID=A0A8H3UGH7_VENIN|nr:hypothetical protein EG328_007266 [Venturia inaequalis]